MAQYRAAWLIGSYASMPATEVTVNAVLTAVTGGDWYLWDATATWSLCALMQNTLTAAGVAGGACVLQRDGKIKLSAAGVFSVTWGVGTLLRDMLGFTGNISGSASYSAPNQSPLLFMPGKPETPMAQRLGTAGHKTHTVYMAIAPYSGKAESVSHGSRQFARYFFPLVDTDLMVDDSNTGGTWGRWTEEVAVKAARWKLYRGALEDPTDTAAVTASLDQPLGPYVVTDPNWRWDTSKGFERTDARADLDIKCHVVEEYA